MASGAVLPTGAANVDLLAGEKIMHMDILLPPPQPPGQPPHTPTDRGQSFATEGSVQTGSPPPVDDSAKSFKFSTPYRDNSHSGTGKLSQLSTTMATSITSSSPAQPGTIRSLTPPRYTMKPSAIRDRSPGAAVKPEPGPFAWQSGSGKMAPMQSGSFGMANSQQSGSSGLTSPLRGMSNGLTTPRSAVAASPFQSSGMSPQRGVSPACRAAAARAVSPGIRVSPTSGVSTGLLVSAQRAVSPHGSVLHQRAVSPLVGTPGPARYRATSPHSHANPGAVHAGTIQQRQHVPDSVPSVLGSPQYTSFIGLSPTPSFQQGTTPGAEEGAAAAVTAAAAAAATAAALAAAGPTEAPAPSAVVASADATATPPGSDGISSGPEHFTDHRLWEAEQTLKQHIAEVRARFDRHVRVPLHQRLVSPVREHHTRTVNRAVSLDQQLGQHVTQVSQVLTGFAKLTGFDEGANAGGTVIANKLDRHLSETHGKIVKHDFVKRYTSPPQEQVRHELQLKARLRAAQDRAASCEAAAEAAHHAAIHAWDEEHAAKAEVEAHENPPPASVRLLRAAEEKVVKPFHAYVHNMDQRVGRTLHSARESIDKSLERTGFQNGVTEGVTAMVQRFERMLDRSFSPRRSPRSKTEKTP